MSNSQTAIKLTERTGVAMLDAIIDDYKSRDSFSDDMPKGLVRVLSEMRDCDKAQNMCETISTDFLAFAKAHPLIGKWQPFMLKDADSRLWGLDVCAADDCGNPHTVVAFSDGAKIHTIDFTAAQYGCNLFPAVGRLDSNCITKIRQSG